MLKSLLTFTIAIVLSLAPVSFYAQQNRNDDAAKKTQAVRDKVRGYSADGKTKLKAELLNGTASTGFLTRSDDAGFDLTDDNRRTTTIAFADVKSVGRKSGFWTAKKGILIGAAAAAAITLGAIIYKRCNNEPGSC